MSTGTGSREDLSEDAWLAATAAGAGLTGPDGGLPDPVIEEVDEGELDGSDANVAASTDDATLGDDGDGFGVDAWDDRFTFADGLASAGHVRVDSRRWLLLPERYTYKPLRGLPAARAVDDLTAAPFGKALLAFAGRLRRQREALRSLVAGEFAEAAAAGSYYALTGRSQHEAVEAEVDSRIDEYAQLALEELLGDAPGFRLYDWALGWLASCEVRRVPLPSRRVGEQADAGGPVHAARGASSWETYYEGRHVHLVRLAAAVVWGSLGPFFFDLRPRR